MLLGPLWRVIGEPGAAANSGCCAASEGVLPGGQEMKNEDQDAVSKMVNRPKRLIVAGILIFNARLLSSR